MKEHATGCLVCGLELHYGAAGAAKSCVLCGSAATADVACQQGHYVCDHCHSASANEVIERVCQASTSTDPLTLAIALMRSPTVKMHGPEHHFLVPAALLCAFANVAGRTEQKAAWLAEARRRAERVPGGFCGSHGNCGAGVGTGIFWSVVTGATPLSKDAWRQSNTMTARSLLRIAESGGPRCCKRDSYLAILEAVEQTALHLGVRLETPAATICEFPSRNRDCLRQDCAFFAPTPQ